ncbi:FBD domain-containing protein [Heracleum sosnowskyi]|uniref:FBD domain-containing protein n=1 Tax=Heracleum sosnowskyi TaxID=360622 RepID=A0AAD8IIW6_9APIA|nr:FBD domain-containing protein [Heracleum sosnowskyi]
MKEKENVVLSPKYMYIRELIPVILDLNKVQYTCWSNLFRNAAWHYNLLHHIDSTVPSPLPDINSSNDAVVLSWIYATISPYLVARLQNQLWEGACRLQNQLSSDGASAMHVWECLREMCQQHNTRMRNKKRRFIHIINLDKDFEDDHINVGVDLISALPDDVLVYMLSLVADMKTAARTCLLSKRWTHVWTHLMNLDLNDTETSGSLIFVSFAQPEMDKFVDMVNQVVIANRASYLESFRIHFPLNTSYASHIHNWVKFVFNKEVRNLDLNFRATTYPSFDIFNISTNPSLILNTTLKSLRLRTVTIKRPLLPWVLTNCLNLQLLSLHHCKASADDDIASSKHHRKLVVSSLQLKHLEFFDSLRLLNVEVLHLSAPNLTSLILYESEIDVEYRSVPSLVDATFGGLYTHMNSLSGFSSQLEKLSIRWNKVHSASSRFPSFVNIRQLEIVFQSWEDDLILSASLIGACPLMHTFKLKLMSCEQLGGPKPMRSPAPNDAQIKAISSHQHLKVVEYLGYAGCASASELALCLTWHAPMLRRFIFDTRRPRYIGNSREVCISEYRDQMDIVRRTTEMLAKRLQWRQNHVDVVIL